MIILDLRDVINHFKPIIIRCLRSVPQGIVRDKRQAVLLVGKLNIVYNKNNMLKLESRRGISACKNYPAGS